MKKIFFILFFVSYLSSQDADFFHKEALKSIEAGELKQALRLLDKALQLKPEHTEAYQTRAEVKRKLDDIPGALKDINRYLQQKTQNAEAYALQSELLIKAEHFSEAVNAAERSLTLNPSLSAPFRYKAVASLKKYDFIQAKKLIAEALKRDAKDPVNYVVAGDIEFQAGNFDEAEKFYQKALQFKEFTTAETFYNLALASQHLEEYEKALNFLAMGLQKAPEYVPLYIKRAEIYLRQKQFALALKDIDKALSLNPRSADAYYLRGEIYKNTKRWEDALTAYDISLKILPSDLAKLGKASVLKQMKRFAQAKEILRNLLKENPKDGVVLNNLANIEVATGNYSQALYYYNEALKYAPADPTLRENKAEALRMLDRCNEALGILNRLLREYPENKELYLKRALCYFKEGNPEATLKDLAVYESKNGEKSLNYYITKGLTLLHLKKYDEAVEVLEAGLQLYPDDITLLFNLASVYGEIGEPENALDLYGEILRLKPDLWKAKINRAQIYVKYGEPNKALQDLSDIIRKHPNVAIAYFNRGIIYYNNKEKVKACEDWKQAKSLGFKEAEQLLNEYCK